MTSYGQIFGTVRVNVIDPQNGSVPHAQVIVRAKNSQWAQLAKTNADGIAVIQAVPIGDYIISVSAEGFAASTDKATQVTSDKVTPLQVQLAVGGIEHFDGRLRIEPARPVLGVRYRCFRLGFRSRRRSDATRPHATSHYGRCLYRKRHRREHLTAGFSLEYCRQPVSHRAG